MIQSEYEVDVIIGKKARTPNFDDPRVKIIRYVPTEQTTRLLDNLSLDLGFRSGFWRFSLERIFVVFEHHRRLHDSVLHFESDIFAFPNFPFYKFREANTIFWAKVDDKRDAPAIIFLPEGNKIALVEELLRVELEKGGTINDMQLLSRTASKMSDFIKCLPTIENENSQLSSSKVTERQRKLLSENFETFGGVFDPAGIGIWLTGTDPRNYFGITKKFSNKSDLTKSNFVNPSNVKYVLTPNGELRYQSSNESFPIFNIHIHSKSKRYFSQNYERHLQADIRKMLKGKERKEFSITVLFLLILENLRKGTLVRFLTWLPLFQKMRKLLEPPKREMH